MLKKVFVLILNIFVVFNFSGCIKNESEKISINIATLKGPTGLGMLKVIDDNEKNETANSYNISIFSDPSDITARLINGEIDVATIPTNMASMIYNKTNGNIQIAAVNTIGVLYVLSSNNDINSISDLKGHKIFVSGKSATPEYILKYILNKNDLEIGKDVIIEYRSEHEELALLAISGKADIVLLPEPFATQVVNKNSRFKINLNLTDEWNKISLCDSSLTMGCIAVRKQFAEQKPLLFNKFLNEYEQSVKFVNTYIEKAAELSDKHNIMMKDVALHSISKCNITFILGQEMKSKVNEFLNILFEFEPKSVGGKMPNEEFYYKKQNI